MAGPSRNKLTRLTPQHLIEQQLRAIGVPSILDTRLDALLCAAGHAAVISPLSLVRYGHDGDTGAKISMRTSLSPAP